MLLGTIGNPVPGTTAGQFTISIDWGDGSGTDTSSGAVSSAGTQIFNVSGTHTYAVPGLYTIQATVRHADGRSAVIASSADIVGNALVASGSAFPAKQNVALAGQLVASFTDPEGNVNPAAYTASIHWGDGSTSGGAITYSAGAFAVRGDHTYVVAGNQALSVDITCPADGRTAQVAYTVNVAPGDLSATAYNISGTAHISIDAVRIASFHDPDLRSSLAQFTAGIGWGDGAVSPGTIVAMGNGDFDVYGSHMYLSGGVLTVTIAIAHTDGRTASASATANIAGEIIAVSAADFSGLSGSPAIFGGSFSLGDASAVSGDFQATVQWGDGNVSGGTITQSGPGSFGVLANHTYTLFGVYPVQLDVHRIGEATFSADATGTIRSPIVASAAASIDAVANVPFDGVVLATFSVAETNSSAGDFQAAITWGDGGSGAGVIDSLGGGNYQVLGSHTYTQVADQVVGVTITTADGRQADVFDHRARALRPDHDMVGHAAHRGHELADGQYRAGTIRGRAAFVGRRLHSQHRLG